MDSLFRDLLIEHTKQNLVLFKIELSNFLVVGPNLFYLFQTYLFCSKLNILKLPDLFKHETAKYRFFHDDLPTTLTELFVKNSNVTNRITRFANNREMTLYIPSYTSSKMQRSMKYQGVKI